MIYLQLFWEFFKTGLFAVGGGMATLPFLQEMAAKTGWFTLADLANMVAVSESTPGPIGVNMASYVGYTTGGILGALTGTIGLVTPSVIVILIIAGFLQAFRTNKFVDRAFAGIRPASTGLVGSAALSLIILCLFGVGGIAELFGGGVSISLATVILFAAIWIMTNKVKPLAKLHPIVFIGFGALCGVLFL